MFFGGAAAEIQTRYERFVQTEADLPASFDHAYCCDFPHRDQDAQAESFTVCLLCLL